MQKTLVFLSRTYVFSLSKNAAQALQMRLRRLEMAPQLKISKKYAENIDFSGGKVLAKNKNSTCKK